MVSSPSFREHSDAVKQIGLDAGLCSVGITSADVLEPARSVLPLRKAAGLADSMAFTYRNPDRSTDATKTLPPARSLIAGAFDYRREVQSSGPGVGRVARYAQRDFYSDLRIGLEAMAEYLRDQGFRAQVRADDNALVDRNVAWRAGIGWYGKNANLLVPGVGSWVVLGAVITDAHLEYEPAPVADGCASCRRCIDDCPTQAIVAPGVIDARRCLAWLVQGPGSIPAEFREAVGDRLYGCDDCQDVCPPNVAAERDLDHPSTTEVPEGYSHREVDLIWLLKASDTEVMERVGHWYIADRNPNVVRRTALVALGNSADPSDPAATDVLEHYQHHEDPILSEHAAWARKQLRSRATQ